MDCDRSPQAGKKCIFGSASGYRVKQGVDSLLSHFCEFGFDSSKPLCDALFDLVECILDTLT